MAISADARPHFTTLADFVSRSHREIATLFKEVLLICHHLGLIDKEMFAIDGCKLPSNASKEWSGTHEELEKKYKKIDKAVDYIIEQHQANDQQSFDQGSIDCAEKQKKKLKASSDKIKQFLKTNEKRKGKNGTEVKSNITDNDSAKMKTSHGVIQGYNGVASVDSKHQIIIAAEAYGQGPEHGLLEPMIEQSHKNLRYTKKEKKKPK